MLHQAPTPTGVKPAGDDRPQLELPVSQGQARVRCCLLLCLHCCCLLLCHRRLLLGWLRWFLCFAGWFAGGVSRLKLFVQVIQVASLCGDAPPGTDLCFQVWSRFPVVVSWELATLDFCV
jgi:hypothetical protein